MTETIHDFADRASAEAFLSEQGHSIEDIRNGWHRIDPSAAPNDLPIAGAEHQQGPTRCKVKTLVCDDGSRGFLTYCWTTFDDRIEEFWSNTCTGESGSN